MSSEYEEKAWKCATAIDNNTESTFNLYNEVTDNLDKVWEHKGERPEDKEAYILKCMTYKSNAITTHSVLITTRLHNGSLSIDKMIAEAEKNAGQATQADNAGHKEAACRLYLNALMWYLHVYDHGEVPKSEFKDIIQKYMIYVELIIVYEPTKPSVVAEFRTIWDKLQAIGILSNNSNAYAEMADRCAMEAAKMEGNFDLSYRLFTLTIGYLDQSWVEGGEKEEVLEEIIQKCLAYQRYALEKQSVLSVQTMNDHVKNCEEQAKQVAVAYECFGACMDGLMWCHFVLKHDPYADTETERAAFFFIGKCLEIIKELSEVRPSVISRIVILAEELKRRIPLQRYAGNNSSVDFTMEMTMKYLNDAADLCTGTEADNHRMAKELYEHALEYLDQPSEASNQDTSLINAMIQKCIPYARTIWGTVCNDTESSLQIGQLSTSEMRNTVDYFKQCAIGAEVLGVDVMACDLLVRVLELQYHLWKHELDADSKEEIRHMILKNITTVDKIISDEPNVKPSTILRVRIYKEALQKADILPETTSDVTDMYKEMIEHFVRDAKDLAAMNLIDKRAAISALHEKMFDCLEGMWVSEFIIKHNRKAKPDIIKKSLELWQLRLEFLYTSRGFTNDNVLNKEKIATIRAVGLAFLCSHPSAQLDCYLQATVCWNVALMNEDNADVKEKITNKLLYCMYKAVKIMDNLQNASPASIGLVFKLKEGLRKAGILPLSLADRMSGRSLGDNSRLKIFTVDDIAEITRYDYPIGSSSRYTVYQGTLDDGQVVAIKRYNELDDEHLRIFVNDVQALSQMSHKNIVKLLGYCVEGDVPVIVYEYVSDFNLKDKLQNARHNGASFDFGSRLKVALGCAEGLAYIHSMESRKVIHANIKPANILLGGDFSPQLANFEFSIPLGDKDTIYCSSIVGSQGYLDPMLLLYGYVSQKSDVYSYGVVLLELITGRESIDSNGDYLARQFYDLFREDGKKKKVIEMMDAEIVDEVGEEMVLDVASIAFKCLMLHQGDRPTMGEVAACFRQVISTMP